jgi:initiation factor 1A
VPATQEVTRVRTPRKENHEVLATVGSLLGSKRVTLQCMDGIVRMGRIPGSKNKKMWIHEERRSNRCSLGNSGFQSRCDMEIHKAPGRMA